MQFSSSPISIHKPITYKGFLFKVLSLFMFFIRAQPRVTGFINKKEKDCFKKIMIREIVLF